MKVQRGASRPKHEPSNKNKWHVHGKKLRSDPSLPAAVPESRPVSRPKPKLKRLQKTYSQAAAVPQQDRPPDRGKGKTALPPSPHTNGAAETGGNSDSNDSQAWRSYAKSILQNGEKTEKYHAQYDHAKKHTVLVLKQGQSLCFRGRCLLTCVCGRVEVLGFTIEQGQQPYPLFSPSSHCPLTVTALGECSLPAMSPKERRLHIKRIISRFLSSEPQKQLLSEVDGDCCVLILQALETPLTRFLGSFSDYSHLFGLCSKELISEATQRNPALSTVGVTPLQGGWARGLVTSTSYKEALSTLLLAWEGDYDRCPIIIVCGAKNSGKSTFVRHLINSLLNQTASVDYLECDIGQTEFTPPGCLSLSTVTEPLLGPPFTHQRDPDHMVFYGQADCQADLDRYLDSIKWLWRQYSGENPIIINTMGWVKGHGLQLLVDLVRLLEVTHVVQLSYGNTPQCPALTPDFIRTAQGWHTHPPTQAAPALVEEPANQPVTCGHTLLSVHSEFEGAGSAHEMRHQRSNELRDLALLGYLSQLQSAEPGPVLPLHCLTPYQVPHVAVALGVTHCDVAPNHILYAANASLVALCCLSEKVAGRGGPVLLSQTPICQCVGLGVVRGVDMARGLYYLVTPVQPEQLRQVNCLLLGEVTLPKILLTQQRGADTEPPYITTDYSFDIAGAGKLHVFKGMARPSTVKPRS